MKLPLQVAAFSNGTVRPWLRSPAWSGSGALPAIQCLAQNHMHWCYCPTIQMYACCSDNSASCHPNQDNSACVCGP
jgi:hypothetical protein